LLPIYQGDSDGIWEKYCIIGFSDIFNLTVIYFNFCFPTKDKALIVEIRIEVDGLG
jgi:hypothetical protein